jgi:serine/threonine protein phosphatase PrpC
MCAGGFFIMMIAVAALTERGDRVVNEDAVSFLANDDKGCFILADGAGGHGFGDIAAKAVVKEMLGAFSAQPSISNEVLQRGLGLARSSLDRERRVHPGANRMDSTVACLLLDTGQRRALWLQLGDSRIYLFRNQRAHLLTRDHSVLQSIIDAGLHRGSVRGARDRNRLYASVCAEDTPADMLSTAPIEIEEGDMFLLCSDGFWDTVDEQLMEGCLRQSQNPRDWLEKLFGEGRSVSHGWGDNATALAVWLGCKDETTFFGTRPEVTELA